jgi:hypothetical protein
VFEYGYDADAETFAGLRKRQAEELATRASDSLRLLDHAMEEMSSELVAERIWISSSGEGGNESTT